MKALGLKDLRGAPACGHPSEELWLHARCHLSEPTWAVIRPNGVLEVVCSACEKVVVRLNVADESKEVPDA